jgi:heat shock protein HtpX
MLLLAPMAAGLIHMAISRTREFSADATSARTLGNAQPMIDALAKLDSIGRQIPLDGSLSMSHLYIIRRSPADPSPGCSPLILLLRNGLRRCAECQ